MLHSGKTNFLRHVATIKFKMISIKIMYFLIFKPFDMFFYVLLWIKYRGFLFAHLCILLYWHLQTVPTSGLGSEIGGVSTQNLWFGVFADLNPITWQIRVILSHACHKRYPLPLEYGQKPLCDVSKCIRNTFSACGGCRLVVVEWEGSL